MSAPRFDVEWDDRAQGFRVHCWDDDADVPCYLPGPGRATDHPWFAGSCAASLAARSASSDDVGLLWESEQNEAAESDARRGAEAATLALADLTRAEVNALKAIVALGMPVGSAKRTLANLRGKGLIDEGNKATPAGRARAKGLAK